MTWKIQLFKTYSDEKDVQAVASILRRGTYWALGPEIEEFEKKIAIYSGSKHCLAFNSGTSALHAMLLAHGIKSGEVIVPSFTFIATANTVVLAGAKPIFAEAELDTFGLDAEDVAKRINPQTKAIMPVHYGGFVARDIVKLRKLADERNILLLEDAAESLGATLDGRMAGTFGQSAVYSFCQNKLVSTGEGGCIVTNSDEVFEKAKLIRSHGRVELREDYFASAKDNDYIEAGYNYRMPTMLAALGMSQLAKVDSLISMRTDLADRYNKELKLAGVTLPPRIKGNKPVYQMYTILLENEQQRDGLQHHLAQKGIMSKVYFNPIHLKTLYMKRYGWKKGDLPVTELISSRALTLPLYPGLKNEEQEEIIGAIRDFFKA